MHWQQRYGRWACPQHGPGLSGEQAAERLRAAGYVLPASLDDADHAPAGDAVTSG